MILKDGFNLFCAIFVVLASTASCRRQYTKEDILRLREEVRDMFQHAYQGYLDHAVEYDELRPLTCDGVDTWGSYSLTLIDALDTLAIMGNYTEFRRVVGILVDKMNFDNDINVSVFETNIRIVGGLLSAHLLSRKAGLDLEPGWPCNGPLLRMAEDVARRLLPAFDTKTGMPYGTVNLRHGVPTGETTVTCTAGVGTFIVEFGALSRLTGDPIYEETALNALYALWKHKSPIGLFGNHLDVQTGRWTAQDAGIGAAVDSYYEYLVKGSLMLNRPDLLEMFHAGRKSIDKYLKRDDWYVWVSMNKGQVTLPVFQSLEAYWPGVLSIIGDISSAMKSIHNYHSVWRQYGFLPEFYNIPTAEAGANRENYPLRPELVESAMYLYRATKDPFLLEIGEDMLRSIQTSAKTPCGYSTVKNVRDHRQENRMESFFLAETTKYLYLLFDPDNFLHNDGREGVVFDTPNGQCVIEAGGYIFNTEAHPIDPSALSCCYDLPREDIFADFDESQYSGDLLTEKAREDRTTNDVWKCGERVERRNDNLTIDIEIVDASDAIGVLDWGTDEVDKKSTEKPVQARNELEPHEFSLQDVYNIYNDDDPFEGLQEFMETHRITLKWIADVGVFGNLNGLNADVSSLSAYYEEYQRTRLTQRLYEAFELASTEPDRELLTDILDVMEAGKLENLTAKQMKIKDVLLEAQQIWQQAMTNVTEMFQFTVAFTTDARKDQNLRQFVMTEGLRRAENQSMVPENVDVLDLKPFKNFLQVVKLKKGIAETISRLQSLLEQTTEQTEPQDSAEPTTPEVTTANDDIISATTDHSDETKQSQRDPDRVHFKSTPSGTPFNEPKNNSGLTDFVQSILKSTVPAKAKFDSQLFLQKIRSQGQGYLEPTTRYELLTCRALPHVQRYSYRGEFF